MSTRSGKRIHSSISEYVESVTEIQTERNTRSKRVKENGGKVETGKKKNFVSRPSYDEVESSNDKRENNSKSVRKSRRHTLKEPNIPADDYEALNDRKSMRLSRRTRKEDTVEPKNVFILKTNELETETKEKKKKKKKRAVIENLENEPIKAVIISKKKTNKKKRKSNSFTVEELVTGEHNKSFNKSNASIDSFHSAAGSPGGYKDDNFLIEDKIEKHRLKRESSSLISYNSVENVKDTKKKNKKTETSNQFESSLDKTVKLCALNESFESSGNKKEEIGDENVNRLEKEISDTMKTKSKQKRSKKIKISSNIDNTHKKGDLIHSLELHNSVEAIIQAKDLEKKTIQTIISPTSNFDFINIPQETLNDLESVLRLKKSPKKIRNSTSKSSPCDKIDISITLLNECNKDMSDNLINKTKVQLDEITTNNSTRLEHPKTRKSKDATYENINLSGSNLDLTFDKTNNSFNKNCNIVKELSHTRKNSRRESSTRRESTIKNTTYDKIDDSFVDLGTTLNHEPLKDNSAEANSSAKSRRSSRISVPQGVVSTVLNGTYDKLIKDNSSSFCNNTYDKPTLDNTFERTTDNIDGDITKNVYSKSSIISSDNTDMTSDMSEDCSRISIASDDSKTENIVNTTPLLIESSMDESEINSASILLNKTTTPPTKEAVTKIITPDKQASSSDNKRTPLGRGTFTETKTTPLKRDGTYTELRKTPSKQRSTLIEEQMPQGSQNPTTPLQREGTFTKESPDVMSPKPKSAEKTPTRRKSMPSPGRTPFPSSGSGSKGRITLNVTHSIEKPQRRSSVAAAPPRLTRVMFCSPVDNPVAVTQMKGKVIKSNLKGSSKSFMFDESASEQCGSRKRSRTQAGAEIAIKRARTASAAARLQAPVPAEVTSPLSKPRTKLPDFAALHRKQFSKMESLDECQRRHARRARALLTPPALLTPTAPPTQTASATPTASLTPILPKGTLLRNNLKETSDTAQLQASKKSITQKSKEVDKKNQSYTRFGFKLNLDVNPFSLPAKTADINSKDVIKPKVLTRQATQPSLAGTTLRKEAARQAVMREKSFTDKRDVNRNQNRTVIKGVRTNRRFELQMKMRNID